MKYLLGLFLGICISNTVQSQRFFEVETPAEAQVKLWFVEDESTCDYRIYFVYTAEEANVVGHWFEVDKVENSDIKIIFVDDPKLADLNVCMTDDPKLAGWVNTEKKHLIPFEPK